MDRALDTDINVEALTHTCEACGRLVSKGWGLSFKPGSANVNREPQAQSSDIVKCLFCAIRHIPMVHVPSKWRLWWERS